MLLNYAQGHPLYLSINDLGGGEGEIALPHFLLGAPMQQKVGHDLNQM